MWNSIHVIEAREVKPNARFDYRLTTTVIVSMAVDNESVGAVDLAGHMTMQDAKVNAIVVGAIH
jgi:hypothetical protein